MTDNLYFCGSIYKRIKHGRGVKETIAKAEGLPGHLMTSWHGKPVIVMDGKLYLFIGKQEGFQGVEWEKINGRN